MYAVTCSHECEAFAPARAVADNAELCGKPAAACRGNTNFGEGVGGGQQHLCQSERVRRERHYVKRAVFWNAQVAVGR